MKLRDADLLARHLIDRDCTQARLARKVGRSRQFINKLVAGSTDACSTDVARAIEEELNVVPGTLFMPSSPREMREGVSSKAGAAA